jgi:hypothetical protein
MCTVCIPQYEDGEGLISSKENILFKKEIGEYDD